MFSTGKGYSLLYVLSKVIITLTLRPGPTFLENTFVPEKSTWINPEPRVPPGAEFSVKLLTRNERTDMHIH